MKGIFSLGIFLNKLRDKWIYVDFSCFSHWINGLPGDGSFFYSTNQPRPPACPVRGLLYILVHYSCIDFMRYLQITAHQLLRGTRPLTPAGGEKKKKARKMFRAWHHRHIFDLQGNSKFNDLQSRNAVLLYLFLRYSSNNTKHSSCLRIGAKSDRDRTGWMKVP